MSDLLNGVSYLFEYALGIFLIGFVFLFAFTYWRTLKHWIAPIFVVSLYVCALKECSGDPKSQAARQANFEQEQKRIMEARVKETASELISKSVILPSEISLSDTRFEIQALGDRVEWVVTTSVKNSSTTRTVTNVTFEVRIEHCLGAAVRTGCYPLGKFSIERPLEVSPGVVQTLTLRERASFKTLNGETPGSNNTFLEHITVMAVRGR